MDEKLIIACLVAISMVIFEVIRGELEKNRTKKKV
jgi:hypothetical protein